MYQCRSHVSCACQLRVYQESVTWKWYIQISDTEHSQIEVENDEDWLTRVPQHIKAKLRPHILSCTPTKAIEHHLSKADKAKIRNERAFTQAVNVWKKSLVRRQKGPIALESYQDIAEWASYRIHLAPVALPPAETGESEVVEGGPEPHSDQWPAWDSLVVLGIDDELGIIVFTTPGLLQNLRMGQFADIDLFLSADGTYKIHFGRYVFITVGTYSIEYEGTDCAHRFRPIAFCLAPSESEDAVGATLRFMLDAHRRIYGNRPSVRVALSDRARGIRAAVRDLLPNTKVRACIVASECLDCKFFFGINSHAPAIALAVKWLLDAHL